VVVVAWRLVAAGRVSVWVAMTSVVSVLGIVSLATGRVHLSPRVEPGTAALAGAGAGVALYVATVGFVLVVRRWPAFDRHVAAIYDQRKGLSLPVALLLAAGATAAGEELFWRGLVQWRLAETLSATGAAILTWAGYVVANAASGSLPIFAGGVVAGAVWGGLSLWTHGVLASLLSHAVWTGLMVSLPPWGARR
jgi:membrane protease YdiL (CAAX protease family)